MALLLVDPSVTKMVYEHEHASKTPMSPHRFCQLTAVMIAWEVTASCRQQAVASSSSSSNSFKRLTSNSQDSKISVEHKGYATVSLSCNKQNMEGQTWRVKQWHEQIHSLPRPTPPPSIPAINPCLCWPDKTGCFNRLSVIVKCVCEQAWALR